MMAGVTVRKGRKADSEEFLLLVKELARFEKLDAPDKEAERRILGDVFERKRLGLFVAESMRRLIGYALYFYSYSSFLARPSLYLEDIYVDEEFRGRGIGGLLFRRCVKEASKNGCGRMEWAVLAWNTRAMGFYEKIGARRLDEWSYYRLDRGQILRMVSGKNQKTTVEEPGTVQPPPDARFHRT
jgi:GNAT superfamily N-acetyltransferase